MDGIKDQDNLIINRKTVSIAIAICILTSVFVFVAGYFWGYRNATTDIQVSLNKTNFIDQINYSTGEQFASNGMQATDQASQIADADQASNNLSFINPDMKSIIVASEQLEDDAHTVTTKQKYYAELIGFGNLKTAQVFSEKMKKRGYTVIIKKRTGKNSKGRITNWYQAITEDFEDKDKLIQVIDAIKQTEHLQGIKIKAF